MQGQIVRLWRARQGQPVGDGAGAPSSELHDPASDAGAGGIGPGSLALPDPGRSGAAPPEQPVLLMPSGDRRPVHVGEVLPARRQPWPLSLVRLPAVSKRAILAAGLCAGLAAPGLARHLATRVLFGRPAGRSEGVLEITRIVYWGPLNPRAATAIEKVLAAGRR